MRIAIVGAGGFIGTPLCAQLAGHELVKIGRHNAEHSEPVDCVIHLLRRVELGFAGP